MISAKPNCSSKNESHYFTLWLTKLEEIINLRFDNEEKAKRLAAEALTARLELLNEFKDSMKDRDKSYATKLEFDAWCKAIESDMRELRRFKDTMGGKASNLSVYISLGFGALALIISFLKLLIDLR